MCLLLAFIVLNMLLSVVFALYILGDTLMALREAVSADTVRVSNLPEDVTILQLIEQFGMIGSVKVSTLVLQWCCLVLPKLPFLLLDSSTKN